MNNSFTKAQAAEALGISTSTLLRYIRRGVLPEPRRHPVNGWRLWSREEAEALAVHLRVNSSRVNATQDEEASANMGGDGE